MKKSYPLTAREQRVEDWFELPMILVTIFLIATFALPLILELPSEWVQWLAFLNLAVWTTFYLELFVKLYVASNLKRALIRNWSLVAIVTIPLFLPLRIMRASRLLGLIGLLRLQPTVEKFKKKTKELIYGVEYILITMVIFVLCTGFILWQVESRFNGTLTTLPDALWWSLSTITIQSDLGLVPTSTEGKILGFIVSIIGTVLLIIFVARLLATMLKKA